MHVFGSPGSFVCEWSNMPAPDKPVALTLSGRMASPWQPPSSMNEWNCQTNNAPYLTIHLWNPHSKTFVPVVAKGRFDASDRLSLGTVDPVYFRNGFLRLKVTTHSVLQPDADALWLQNIFVHPYSAHKYVNVNTVQPYQLRNLNSADRSLARSLAAKSGPSFHFSSMRDVLDTIQSLFSPVAPSNLFLTVRSDLFDLCVEAEVYKQSDTAPVLLARSQRYIKLNRAPARLNPSHPIQKTF